MIVFPFLFFQVYDKSHSKYVLANDLCLKSLWGPNVGQGPSEKAIWKIFYRAVLENGHPEVHEVHDPLEVP